MSDQMSVEEAVKCFKIMWGKFPIPAMLLHKDRTVVALNGAYPPASSNFVGKKCFEMTRGSKVCPHCEANEAVAENKGRHAISYNWPLQQLRDCYWVPLDGYPDLYVHFGVDITAYALPELCAKEKAIAEGHAERG